jgi:hypothetical protein
MKYHRNVFSIFALVLCLALTGCSGSDSSGDSGGSDVFNNITDIFSDSANVLTVKDSYVQACSTATLGEMADAFMSDPQWRDFQGTSGNTIVELSGGISYDGMPADALIQFEISGGSFEAVYLGINSVDQNMLVLSALLNKMCDAA